MPCLSIPTIPTPDLSLFLPDLAFSIPGLPPLGLSFCCTFELPSLFPGFPIVIPLGLILAALGPAANAVMAFISSAIAFLNALLDAIPPITCPL